MARRKIYASKGRPKKTFPTHKCYTQRLGGIPMKCKKGQISYRDTFPAWDLNTESNEEVERREAILPEGDGSFIRRHIYEVRFGIDNDSDDERRRKEYEKWWNEQEKGKV